MESPPPHEITRLLHAWNQGDPQALESLAPLVYAELHRLAANYLNGERPGHILQTTALINEAWIRLLGWKNVEWKNKAHFLGVSSELMRRVLVDFARSREYQKRGGGSIQVSLSEASNIANPETSLDVVALDEALEKLTQLDARQSRIVEMRFFCGMQEEEIAAALGISVATVKRDWTVARLWLLNELQPGKLHDTGSVPTN